jgi:hypothetical protein
MTASHPKAGEADIALLLEGTFPYVSGGVSSWINQIIRAYPEYRFALVFLGSQRSDYGAFKYQAAGQRGALRGALPLRHLHATSSPRPQGHAHATFDQVLQRHREHPGAHRQPTARRPLPCCAGGDPRDAARRQLAAGRFPLQRALLGTDVRHLPRALHRPLVRGLFLDGAHHVPAPVAAGTRGARPDPGARGAQRVHGLCGLSGCCCSRHAEHR